jgi:hypothetical protein
MVLSLDRVRVAVGAIVIAFCVMVNQAAHAVLYGADVLITFIPTVQNAAYSAGNALGNLQTVPVFARGAGNSGIFNSFQIVAKDGATTAMTVYIFETIPAANTCVDKTALSLAVADVTKLAMAPFVLTPAVVGSGTTISFAQLNQVSSVQNADSPPTANLYVCLVANGTVTPGSTTNLVESMAVALD